MARQMPSILQSARRQPKELMTMTYDRKSQSRDKPNIMRRRTATRLAPGRMGMTARAKQSGILGNHKRRDAFV
jgi:hypothetical protein